MRRQGCMNNGTLGESNYSAPIPVIGLYIAGITMVCLLLMLLDFFTSLRQKKRWIPCRFFRLNSVTLTLIAVATKLPVDLTSTMPSALDQLSKLTGTILICIYMGFLTPSIALTTESECLSNMLSLTIFVITVFVNICIQMRTGVIFLFRAEHIAVLCCMILFLVFLWILAPIAHTQKEVSTDYIKEKLIYGKGSLLGRLKVCYLHSYDHNPQLVLCEKIMVSSPYVICLTCTAILVKVTVRCLVRREYFCGGISDYKWSMWGIVASQIITILLGCLAATFRLITLMRGAGGGINIVGAFDLSSSWFQNMYFRNLCSPAISLILLIEALFLLLCSFIHCFCMPNDKEEDDDGTKEFKELVHKGFMGMDHGELKRSVKDMERWMGSVNKTNTLNHLNKLFSETPPSQDSLASLLQSGKYKISSLSIVVLTKVAKSLVPSTMSESLFNSLDEVLEVIHYIDGKLNSSSLKSRKMSMIAKGELYYFPYFTEPEFDGSTSELQLDLAFQNINKLKEAFLPKAPKKSESSKYVKAVVDKILDKEAFLQKPENESRKYVKVVVDMILDFIDSNRCRTINELCSKIQQIFVDMSNELLYQLPYAVSKDIIESPPEDLEERVKAALKIIHAIEKLKLEGLIRWSFPEEVTITNLITNEVVTAIHEERTPPESSTSNNFLTDMRPEEIGNTENRSSMPPDCHMGNLLPSAGTESVNLIISETARDEIIEIHE